MLTVLLNPKFWGALAIGLLLICLGAQTFRVHSLQVDVNKETLRADGLEMSLAQQNSSIQEEAQVAHALADTNAKQVDAAIKQAKAGEIALSAKIAAINSAKPGPDKCSSALSLVHEAGK